MRYGETFGILYSTAISNLRFNRFTIAHELGHFFISEHLKAIFARGDRHNSLSNFVSYRWHEVEADHFAAELLMPKQPFLQGIARRPMGLDTAKDLADEFQTSLTSTAIRYATLSPDPIAVVVSERGTILSCFVSDSLADAPGIGHFPVEPRCPLPSVPAKRFARDPSLVSKATEIEGTSSCTDWFPESHHEFEFREQSIGLGTYGKVLTILSADSLPDPDEVPDAPSIPRDTEDPWSSGWGDAQR